jgi:predicted nucleic acid-binding protein
LIVLDSSGWLEILTDAPRAGAFRQRLEAAEEVVVPTIILYEVYKIARLRLAEQAATLAVARLRSYTVAPLSDSLALEAADFSLEQRLPMADAIVYATARAYGAMLITGDAHFAELAGVEYLGEEAAGASRRAPGGRR